MRLRWPPRSRVPTPPLDATARLLLPARPPPRRGRQDRRGGRRAQAAIELEPESAEPRAELAGLYARGPRGRGARDRRRDALKRDASNQRSQPDPRIHPRRLRRSEAADPSGRRRVGVCGAGDRGAGNGARRRERRILDRPDAWRALPPDGAFDKAIAPAAAHRRRAAAVSAKGRCSWPKRRRRRTPRRGDRDAAGPARGATAVFSAAACSSRSSTTAASVGGSRGGMGGGAGAQSAREPEVWRAAPSALINAGSTAEAMRVLQERDEASPERPDPALLSCWRRRSATPDLAGAAATAVGSGRRIPTTSAGCMRRPRSSRRGRNTTRRPRC